MLPSFVVATLPTTIPHPQPIIILQHGAAEKSVTICASIDFFARISFARINPSRHLSLHHSSHSHHTRGAQVVTQSHIIATMNVALILVYSYAHKSKRGRGGGPHLNWRPPNCKCFDGSPVLRQFLGRTRWRSMGCYIHSFGTSSRPSVDIVAQWKQTTRSVDGFWQPNRAQCIFCDTYFRSMRAISGRAHNILWSTHCWWAWAWTNSMAARIKFMGFEWK